jgi:hypothetical protein
MSSYDHWKTRSDRDDCDDGAEPPHEWDADDECERLQEINGALVTALAEALETLEFHMSFGYQPRGLQWDKTATPESTIGKCRAALAKAASHA